MATNPYPLIPDPSRPRRAIDYQAAAEQLIAVLAAVARTQHSPHGSSPMAHGSSPRPVAAATLARLVFGFDLYKDWSHETRRRRIRDTAVVARQLLARDQATAQIAADGRGYWLTGSAAELAAYAARRKRHGLAHLAAAAHQVKPTLAPAAGQGHLLQETKAAPGVGAPGAVSSGPWGKPPRVGQESDKRQDTPPSPAASTPAPSADLFAPIPKPMYRH